MVFSVHAGGMFRWNHQFVFIEISRVGMIRQSGQATSTKQRNKCTASGPISEENIEKTAHSENKSCVRCIKVTTILKEGLF